MCKKMPESSSVRSAVLYIFIFFSSLWLFLACWNISPQSSEATKNCQCHNNPIQLERVKQLIWGSLPYSQDKAASWFWALVWAIACVLLKHQGVPCKESSSLKLFFPSCSNTLISVFIKIFTRVRGKSLPVKHGKNGPSLSRVSPLIQLKIHHS